MAAVRRILRAAALDVRPLRHREFRLLFVGQGVSLAGSMITYVALPFQVYALTHSTFAVGMLGLAELAPLLATALIGGALADAHDRRRLVLIADSALLLLALVLAVNATLDEPRVWVLFVVAAGMSAAGGLQRPPLDALVPRLVPREALPAASTLESIRYDGAQIAGPAIAGVLIASAGLGATYLLDAATFLASLAALPRMRAVLPPADAAPPSLARITEGWALRALAPGAARDLRDRRQRDVLRAPARALPRRGRALRRPGGARPAVRGGARRLGAVPDDERMGEPGAPPRPGRRAQRRRLRRGDRAVRPDRRASGRPGGARRGRGGRLVLEHLPHDDLEPDDPRRHAGAAGGIEQLSYSIGPTLGTAEAGAVAAVTSVRTSILSGGIGCLAGTVVLCGLLPRFWRYEPEVSA